MNNIDTALAIWMLPLQPVLAHPSATLMTSSTLSSADTGDIFSSAFLLGDIGAPFVIGLSVGYFAKKMLRFALFIGGAAVVILFLGEYLGITTISNTHLENVASTATQAAKSSGDFLIHRLSSITSKGVSGGAGFFVGFKIG